MVTDKVTVKELREMKIGQTLPFDLPTSNAIDSGKSLAYRLQHSLRCKFSVVSDYDNNILTIKKLPRL